MANPKQIKLLKQGINTWNKWRREHPIIKIDLNKANLKGIDLDETKKRRSKILISIDLSEADLRGANLADASLISANLCKADLRGANLRGAMLAFANLRSANLSGADLRETYFTDADLRGAKLIDANLGAAHLLEANLNKADLSGADLSLSDLSSARLKGAILIGAEMGFTFLTRIDFSATIGLEEVVCFSSSYLSTDTLKLSKGKIPQVFLSGCGMNDWEIEAAKLYNPNLTNQDMDEILYNVHEIRAKQPVQISPLFISYSHADGNFVDKLEKHLNGIGVRFWRDIHDATSGKLEKVIDQAIRHNPTVLLVLSGTSINSDWVEHEVRLARDLEKETDRDVLCPVALDETWKSSTWPKRIMEQVMEYNILDFSKWNDEAEFQDKFSKLIDGLDLYYKKQS